MATPATVPLPRDVGGPGGQVPAIAVPTQSNNTIAKQPDAVFMGAPFERVTAFLRLIHGDECCLDGDPENFPIQASRCGLLNLDPAYQGVVLYRGELDHILTAGVRVHRELLDDGFVLGASGRENIKIGQHLRAVDAHVKYTRTGR